jgi:hypothetical protein
MDTIIHLYRTTHISHCVKYNIYTLRDQMSKPYYLLYMFRVKYLSSGVTMNHTHITTKTLLHITFV